MEYLEQPERRSVAAVLDLAQANDGVILVNPDNPTGAYLSHAEVRGIATELKRTGRLLILDESFVGFASEGSRGSLLTESLLAEYPNIIVVKSISKSFGVPGARLGVVATSNREILQRCGAGLPVWNVNSLGELFLQIIGKYESDYWNACRRLHDERQRFTEALAGLDFADLLPSEANFVMCRPRTYEATWLARELLPHGILIRDLTGKRECPARNTSDWRFGTRRTTIG
ncbi:MAG: aminotransferase class I/II-fold pyridoxal phosphate-dependent enzyme [Candidatus Nanopelagicales bacterium]